MKIAVISDIHANIHALSVVLSDIKERNCDAVFCLGDYIGYYYWPNEVLDALRAIDVAFFIKGNHEDLYFKAIKDEGFRNKIKLKYGLGIEYAIDLLSDGNKNFLRSIDESMVIDFSGIKFGLYHGSPNKIDEYIYPDVAVDKFNNFFNIEVDVILLGHTHHQYSAHSAQIKNKLIINPGSVGQARDVRGLAAYSILNLRNMAVTSIRLPYDMNEIFQTIGKVEFNKTNMISALLGRSEGKI